MFLYASFIFFVCNPSACSHHVVLLIGHYMDAGFKSHHTLDNVGLIGVRFSLCQRAE